MPFNIANFRSSLQFDGARASLFDIVFNVPTPLAGQAIVEQVKFKGRASSLPGDSISSIPVNYFGREIKVAGTRTFPDWSVTIINDEDFYVRNVLELWMSGINSHVENRRRALMATSSGYSTDMFITQYTKTGAPTKVYKLVGAFPIDVAPIDVDWASGDQIEEFQVTLSYQWWESIKDDNMPDGSTTGSRGTVPIGAPEA